MNDNLLKLLKSTTTLLLVITLLSKMMGFVREMVISYYMGVSASYDDILLALTVPTLVISVMHYTIPHSIIPRLSGVYQNFDYNQIVLNIIRKLGMAFIIIALMYFFTSGFLLKYLATELSDARRDNILYLSHYLSIYLLLVLFYEIFYAILQSEQKFSAPVIIGFVAQLILIVSVCIYGRDYAELGLLIGYIIGAIFQFFLVVLYYVKLNNFKLFDRIVQDFPLFDKAFLFVLLIELVGQLSGFIDRFFASQLEIGRISALNYANTLITLPTSIFIYSIGTVFFLKFRDSTTTGNSAALKIELKKVSFFFGIFSTAAIVAFFVLPTFTVQFIFERGKFDVNATELTSSALWYFSFGIPFILIHAILTRIMLVWRQELFLFKASLVTIIVKITLSYLFVKPMSHNGLALATSISYFLTVLILLIKFYFEFKRTSKLSASKASN